MWIYCDCQDKVIQDRYKKKNEIEGDLGEEQVGELGDQTKALEATVKEICEACPDAKRCDVKTDVSAESLTSNIAEKFKAKILIVNHEKRLTVDAQCCNLATKYGMLYISVYQLIKHHIENCTEWGKKLEACRKSKDLSSAVLVAEGIKDEFNEAAYSAVHFSFTTVVDMINDTISQKRCGEEYVLLEGLCNNHKMENENDRLQRRNMDEFFAINMRIGKVAGFISLTFKEEDTHPGDAEYEQFEEPEAEEVKEAAPAEGEGEEEAPAEAPPAEEEGEKKDKWDPKDFQWTVSNRKSKNLALLYRDSCGGSFESEIKKANDYGDSSADQISKALDEFCQCVTENPKSHRYQQVVFKE